MRGCRVRCATRERTAPRAAALAGLLLGCAAVAHAEPVTFTVNNIRSDGATLIVALFRPTHALWDKRFKRVEQADLFCKHELHGKQASEVVRCDLPPSEYIGLAFVDSDRNGTLTHGVAGPTEQFGLTGIEEAIRFPPEPSRTVIDTKARQDFVIVLN